MADEFDEKKENKDIWRLAWRIGIPVVVVWGLCLFIGILIASCGGIARMGSLGDSFGIINSLFSSLAFAAVALTLYKQEKDSKDADKKHREILDRQQAIFEQNAKIALFEKRCRIHQSVVDFLDYANGADKVDPAYQLKFINSGFEVSFLFPDVPTINTDMQELADFARVLISTKYKRLVGRIDADDPRLVEARDDLNKKGAFILSSMHDALDLEYPKKK